MRRILALTGIMLIVACGERSDTSEPANGQAGATPSVAPVRTDPAGKFDQTWKKGYAETTCEDWRANMSENERRIAAADMLTSARGVDKNKKLPNDPLIADFEQNISTACEADVGQTIDDMAVGVYLIDKPHWLR